MKSHEIPMKSHEIPMKSHEIPWNPHEIPINHPFSVGLQRREKAIFPQVCHRARPWTLQIEVGSVADIHYEVGWGSWGEWWIFTMVSG